MEQSNAPGALEAPTMLDDSITLHFHTTIELVHTYIVIIEQFHLSIVRENNLQFVFATLRSFVFAGNACSSVPILNFT